MSRPFDRIAEAYSRNHAHPMNQIAHMIGVPIVGASILVLFFSRKVGLSLFAGGWALQFLGHAIEGNRPSLLSDPRALAVGPFWVARKWLTCVRRRPREEARRRAEPQILRAFGP